MGGSSITGARGLALVARLSRALQSLTSGAEFLELALHFLDVLILISDLLIIALVLKSST